MSHKIFNNKMFINFTYYLTKVLIEYVLNISNFRSKTLKNHYGIHDLLLNVTFTNTKNTDRDKVSRERENKTL